MATPAPGYDPPRSPVPRGLGSWATVALLLAQLAGLLVTGGRILQRLDDHDVKLLQIEYELHDLSRR